ncbi:[FeFe] hydrogenase H-cluster radical SAM maturase HydE [Labilibacter marinus]|uniref:[FeFe] hydrogenase H-cluster radical SAM maturase HydE n=1 Tax=Labilibacter marinus TaxID=1477105 RepID=UPI0008302012|nr:[FeFe] hydrogenase H-cluster radical SAM maturase HydE [Labilibacter marinus]
MQDIQTILDKETLEFNDIVILLKTEGEEQKMLFKKAQDIQLNYVGKKVFYRGLVEFSNVCSKNCLYCGIRKDNKDVERYNLEDEHVIEAAKFAHENNYASMVLQAGERSDEHFIERVDLLLKRIKKETNGELGITISLGEQSEETYKKWFESGAHRYLLRIESSNKVLYNQIHPNNDEHDFESRLSCLKNLKKVGYQTGTGVMVGLPWQTFEDLARDILFMKDFDIDMCGMGPYIEHQDTPLYEHRNVLWPIKTRFSVTLNMIAILRIVMKDINIAAATALQAIDPMGREKALRIGANVIMPNITPTLHRKDYQLYENKPCTDEGAEDCGNCLSMRIELADREVGLGEWGDSKHFANRNK